jgi:hypothetical protein
MSTSRIEWRTPTSFIVRPTAPRRRRADPTPLLALTAAFAAIVAVAAGISFQHNVARLQRFEDPSCAAAALDAPEQDVIVGTPVCTIASAQLVDHWIHSFRHGDDYFYALRLSNGDVDTVSLESSEGATPRMLWDATPLGARFAVQRFREDAHESKPHVTLVRLPSEDVRTDWNPKLRSGDAVVGAVVFALIALGSGAGAWQKRRRTR